MRQHLRHETPPIEDKASGGDLVQERLAAKLWASFEDAPVEDGFEHAAEDIIGEALRCEDSPRVLDWLRQVCVDTSQPNFAASVLRCLGRQDDAGTASWRAGLVRDGLAVCNVEVRDATVQAVESWADRALLAELRAHTEPEPWLRRYICDVIDDLGG